MLRSSTALILSLGLGLALTACVSNTERRLEKKEEAETSVRTTQDLHRQADQLIQDTPGLTIEQKENLTVLKVQIESDMNTIRDESVRLRSVLLNDVLTNKKYNDLEVAMIKKQMHNLEERRIEVLFNAVAKANSILGHMTDEKAQQIQRLFDIANPVRD